MIALFSVSAILQFGEVDGLIVMSDSGGMNVRHSYRHVRQM